MAGLPRVPTLDDTAALLREGYLYMGERRRRLRSDVFETRLMGGRPAVCVVGEEGARLLYAPDRFTRRGALPPNTLLSLQDRGSVQTLDGEAHRRRKAIFLGLNRPEHSQRMAELFEAAWRERAADWAKRDRVVLFPEMTDLLTRAVCAWAGLPLKDVEARARAREFGAMIDGAGAVGPRNWRGLLLRSRTERWARRQIRRVRSGSLKAAHDAPVRTVALHRDADGELLPVRIAAVELLNLLRPTVAVDRYIVWCALALHEHPEWRDRLAGGFDAERLAFAQEVRRFYPFFPAVGGRATSAFDWRGRTFRKGSWLLLDVHGTNHDPGGWREPERFRPERFLEGEANRFNFCPQGAGDPARSHRCPGEPIVLAVMTRALALLTTGMGYELPEQDLSVDLTRLPAGPASGFVIAGVTPR